ncbi:MAG: TonB-dependent receptor [Pseudomonadota bacterium]
MASKKMWSLLLQTTALVGVATMATPAVAQDDETEDTITVTGTLIQRQDIQAPSPVTSVSAEELKVVNTVNTEDFLNTLPQAIPGFDATSNNPGDGVATANLRGLGAVRTLVLVEGRRFVPYDAGGIVDLNQIPAALIERVDVVTGGASALYGSDAMAGVVNFDLRDDYEGVELNASYDISEQGDGGIFQASILAGGEFADGRGNATFFAAYTDRQPVFQGDRDFSAVANDDAAVGEDFPPFGSAGVPGMRLFDSFDFSNIGYTPGMDSCTAPGGGVAEGLAADCTGGALFDESGSPIPWINSGTNTTRYNYAPVNYLQLPQERYNLAAFANYQLFENTELKLRGTYASNVVAQELAPTPIFDTFTISEDNTAISDDFRTLLEANGDFDPNNGMVDTYDVFLGRRMLEVGPRNSNRDQHAVQWSAETITQVTDSLTWTNYAQFARTAGALSQTGNVSRSAFQDAIDQNCDLYGPNRFSEECVAIVSRTGIIRNAFEQTVLGTSVGGDLAALQSPMASLPVAFVAGVEYREEAGDFQPDSVLGPDVAGFNQSAPIKGRFDVTEFFTEVNVPLIEGAALAEQLNVNGAIRISDYSTVGSLTTWAAGASWSPTEDLTFKVNYNRAARAPNLAELFQPVVNGFPGADDPCAIQTTGGTPAGNQAICTAEGVPASAFGTTALQPNSQIESLFGGNADLTEEVADTFTLGLVAQPSALPGLTVKVDYYNIEIEDVISTIPVQSVLDGCYIDGTQSLCDLVQRGQSGQIEFISLNNQNLALLTAEGIDLDADYGWETGYGDFNVRIVGTYRIEDGFQAFDGEPLNNCSGYFGGRFGQCGEPFPEWKHTMFITHTIEDLTTTLRWRYIGEVTADDAIDPSGALDDFTELRGTTIDAYNYFDLTAAYAFGDNINLSVGIQNIFENEPPIQGDSFQEQANTWPATYDPFGRSYFINTTFTF